jgi:hypothetical protein
MLSSSFVASLSTVDANEERNNLPVTAARLLVLSYRGISLFARCASISARCSLIHLSIL